jgi:hypothetical protein
MRKRQEREERQDPDPGAPGQAWVRRKSATETLQRDPAGGSEPALQSLASSGKRVLRETVGNGGREA